MDTGARAFTEALEDALTEGTLPQKSLSLPKNEATDLLFDLVSPVFVECMTNAGYGLDCYLSMRIRHGTLSGQLRGPLEEQKIITQREGAPASTSRMSFGWNASLSRALWNARL